MKKRNGTGKMTAVSCCISAIIVWIAIGATCQAESRPLEVVYPRPESADDTRDLDAVEILRTALEKTEPSDGAFTMRPTELVMNPARYHEEVTEGDNLNVLWAAPTEQLERDALPIRIPIRKGLLGYRILLIRKQDREKFAKIATIEDLKRLTCGRGLGWKDVEMFKANGFPMVLGNNYEGLFQMLVDERFDYFDRGIHEVQDEYAARKKSLPDLLIEETLALYFPWPKYFFVPKKAPQLAERLERGLNIMIEDGTFDKIFWKYHRESIEAANLKNRRLFRISNPLLPATVPLHRKELWFDPFAEKK